MGMDSFDAAAAQPAPTGDGESVTDAVIGDLVNRRVAGKIKYDTELKTHNGRNALVDAYQEGLDLCCYLRQKIMENSDSVESETCILAQVARNKVNLLRTQIPQSAQWIWNDAMEALNALTSSLGEPT